MDLSKAEGIVMLAFGGALLYLLYKGAQSSYNVGTELYQSGVRGANALGDTVSNTMDNARMGVSDALFSVFGTPSSQDLLDKGFEESKSSSSQKIAAFHSNAGAPKTPFKGYYSDWSYAADTFPEAVKRMQKPGLGEIAQPPTDYVSVPQ